MSYSDSGCPLFEPSDGARLAIEVQRGGLSEEREARHVQLAGNRQGLIALATAMLALAESSDPEHHLHLDDLYEGVVHSPERIGLTIAKLPEMKQ